jgi:hypothetical protein
MSDMNPIIVPVWGLAVMSIIRWWTYWTNALLFKERDDYSIREYLSELSNAAYWVGIGTLLASLCADLYIPGWNLDLLIGAGSVCPIVIWSMLALYLQLRPSTSDAMAGYVSSPGLWAD